MRNSTSIDLKIGELIKIEGKWNPTEYQPDIVGIVSFLPDEKESDDGYWIEIIDEQMTRGPFPFKDCNRLNVDDFKKNQPDRFGKILSNFLKLRLRQMTYVAYTLAKGSSSPKNFQDKDFIGETYKAFQLLGIPHDLPKDVL